MPDLEREWYRAIIASNVPTIFEQFWQEVFIARLLGALRELDDDDELWDFWRAGR